MDSLFIHSLISLHSLSQPAPCGAGIAGGGGRWREDMASGGEGFGTERARLAQGGFRGQFYKEIPLNEFSENIKNLQNFHLRRIRYFWVQNSKNPDPCKEFFFLGVNPPTC